MKRIISKCMLLILVMTTIQSNCFAQIVSFTSTTTTVAPAAPCDHMIQLMLRHGVNNQCDRSLGSRLVNPSSVHGAADIVSDAGDLEVLYANLAPPSEISIGPRLAIAVVNRSPMEARDFHVSVAAIVGQIHPHSPISTVRIDRIGPGESLEVSVPIPVDTLLVGRSQGTSPGFERLIVAVDCFNRIIESDEANNVRLFEYHQLHATATSIPTTNALRSQVPALSLLENAGAGSTSFVMNESRVSVDALDLEQPTPDSLRSAIQSVHPPVPVGKAPMAPRVENPF